MHAPPSGPGLSRRSLLAGAAGFGGLAALGLLTGCAGGAASGGASVRPFTYLSYLPMETLSVAPELLAHAGGYFEKHGLDVEFQTTKGSPQALQTLISGVAPLTRVGAIDVMTAAADGQPLMNVGTIVHASSIRVLYAQDAPLESPEDFVGTTVGVPSEGGTSDKSLSLMLQRAGIDPSEVKRQVVGLGPATFELVRRGDIAGYMVSIDQAVMTMKQFAGEAGAFDAGTQVKSDLQVYTATQEGLDEHGDDIRSYLAAIQEAVEEMISDESLDGVLETMRSEYSFGSLDDEEVAKDALSQARELWTANGTVPVLRSNVDIWAAGYQELIDGGMLPAGAEDLDPTEWVTNDFLSGETS